MRVSMTFLPLIMLGLFSFKAHAHGGIHSLYHLKTSENKLAGENGAKWYRGNTHSHTELCGHADSSPGHVAKWYLDHGYNFLVLSEHNKFIDPKNVVLPNPRRSDFILIPGQEITGAQSVHTTALNVKEVIPWNFDHPEKWRIVQEHIDLVSAAGGKAIVNHPRWKLTLGHDEFKEVERMEFFELYNGSPDSHNFDESDGEGMESIWDKLLSEGKKVYGVASDDAHQFKTRRLEDSTPGTGWIMVFSPKLDSDVIVNSMAKGDFYATSGLVLGEIIRSNEKYVVKADDKASLEMLKKDYIIGHKIILAKTGAGLNSKQTFKKSYPLGWTVEFIGPHGEIFQTTHGPKADYSPKKILKYLRAKITYVRQTQKGVEAFYAWTQPLFQN